MSKRGEEKKLRARFEDTRKKRIAKYEEERPLIERLGTIFNADRYATTDFFCNTCKRDCTGTGYRQVLTLRKWLPTAWYVGTCPNGHKMIRRITDKNTDPYYYQSYMVQRQRNEMEDSFLTPDNPRFKLLYPDKYDELMKKDGQRTKN